MLPLAAALRKRRADRLGHVDVGVALEQGVRVALHGVRPTGVIAQHDMIDPTHAVALGGHGQRRRKIVAALIRRASLLRIQAMHGGQGLQVHCVAGVRGVGESRDRLRLRGMFQGRESLRPRNAVNMEILVALKFFDCRLGARTKITVRGKRAAVGIMQAELSQPRLQVMNSGAMVVFAQGACVLHMIDGCMLG